MLPIMRSHQHYTIVHPTISVACKIWAILWENKVEVLTTGKARDLTLVTCARNIWLLSSLYSIEFMFSHVAGTSNALTDFQSR